MAHVGDSFPSVLIFDTLDNVIHVLLTDAFTWTVSVESDLLIFIDVIAVSTSLSLFDRFHVLLHF